MSDSPQPRTVVELFAGVGGFRIGLERKLGGFSQDTGWAWEAGDQDWSVVLGNQWEPSTKKQHAFDAYAERFGDAGVHSNRDIAAVLNDAGVPAYDGGDAATHGIRHTEGDIPESFELLVGGFPCQDYSVAKPLSQAAGMGGEKGVLWWEIARILQHFRPDHVLLENVDRLLTSPSTQRGRDFAIILACFAQLGYGVEWRVINAADYGYPQRRRRVFIYATHDPRWEGQFGPDAGDDRTGMNAASRLLAETGVLAEALPCSLETPGAHVEDLRLGTDTIDPYHVSENWPRPKSSVWANAGVMLDGHVWTTRVTAEPRSADRTTLGDILLPVSAVLASHPEVVIPEARLGEEGVKASTWKYLKGSKREPRTKTVKGETFEYVYSEGAVAFPEPLDKASRTILTGEGGRSPSRFKHVVKQALPSELLDDDQLPARVRDCVITEDGESVVYRRLTPIELERLNMFPDDWTSSVEMTDGRRAFCMGNALVIGIVHDIGTTLAARLRDREPAAHA